MENKFKKNILLLGLITAITYLVLFAVNNASISVPMFFIIQAISFYIVFRDKKICLFFIPIILIALSSFIYTNNVFELPNLIVIGSIYLLMGLYLSKKLDLSKPLGFIRDMVIRLFESLSVIFKPIDFLGEVFKKKSDNVTRVIFALVITIPILIVILVLLASADMIFAESINKITKFVEQINIDFIFRVVISLIAGLFITGFAYLIKHPFEKVEQLTEKREKNYDVLIVNIVESIILVVYLIFIVIQFRYLFSGSSLPYGITYAEYARDGFFQLLLLTGINLVIIIFSTYVFKDKNNKLNKIYQYILCSVTIILLVSSFYRMTLYSNDFGLTRLRLYVFGFLIFELFGLLITYFYIYKPKFNIVFVYFIICLVYYVGINLVPTDKIIAANLVDRYQNHKQVDISYVTNLSLDATSELEVLFKDDRYKLMIHEYFKNGLERKHNSWQSYNLSYEKAQDIFAKYKYETYFEMGGLSDN